MEAAGSGRKFYGSFFMILLPEEFRIYWLTPRHTNQPNP
jgi:hypothetical protein